MYFRETPYPTRAPLKPDPARYPLNTVQHGFDFHTTGFSTDPIRTLGSGCKCHVGCLTARTYGHMPQGLKRRLLPTSQGQDSMETISASMPQLLANALRGLIFSSGSHFRHESHLSRYSCRPARSGPTTSMQNSTRTTKSTSKHLPTTTIRTSF